jgi:hypothetical protein
MEYSSNLFGKSSHMRSQSAKPKPILKCAGLGGNTSSIAAKKVQAVPKKPVSGIFAAKS